MFWGTRATNFSIYTTKMEGAGPKILGTGAKFKQVPCQKNCRVNRANASRNSDLWPVSRKSRKLFGPEKPFLKLRLAHSVKLVFSYVVKGRKIKITAKFRALRRLRFENTKRTMSPEMRPKSFGSFENRAPGEQSQCLSKYWIK